MEEYIVTLALKSFTSLVNSLYGFSFYVTSIEEHTGICADSLSSLIFHCFVFSIIMISPEDFLSSDFLLPYPTYTKQSTTQRLLHTVIHSDIQINYTCQYIKTSYFIYLIVFRVRMII